MQMGLHATSFRVAWDAYWLGVVLGWRLWTPSVLGWLGMDFTRSTWRYAVTG